MHATATLTLLTAEDLLALPDDGIRRELYRGVLFEEAMTKRSLKHGMTAIQIGWLLKQWSDRQAPPRGVVAGTEVGAVLRRNPDSIVGIDVAYVSPETLSKAPPDSPWIEGPPVLAVEILSPSDKHEDVVRKVKTYLDAGVAQVWIVDPDFQTVQVHRPGGAIDQYSRGMELKGEPDLPGFRAAVADFFVA